MERTSHPLDLNKIALEIFSSEAYLIVNKKLLQYYGPDIAIFLSNLIDKYKYFLDNNKLEDNYFFLIHETQMEQTGLSIAKIRICKSILKKDAILEIILKGLPAKEWYKLNLANLFHIIPSIASRHVLRGQDIEIRDDYIRRPNLNIIPPDKKHNSKERNKQYYPIAEFLANIVQSKKNITYTSTQIFSWTNDIRQLSETNKVNIPRIKNSLKWYRNHINDQYCPVIESGKSLKEKFFKLEAAIERENKVYTKKYDCPYHWKFGIDFNDDKEGCMICQDKDKTNHIYLACASIFKESKKK